MIAGCKSKYAVNKGRVVGSIFVLMQRARNICGCVLSAKVSRFRRICFSMTSATLGDSVKSIGTGAFQNCTNLTYVTIPRSITNLVGSVFASCTNLTAVFFKGNAPTTDSTVFTGDTKASIYYLPRTTGWSSMFSGRPTALWKPQVQAGDASFGVRTNQFGFNIAWASGMVVVVEACANLEDRKSVV